MSVGLSFARHLDLFPPDEHLRKFVVELLGGPRGWMVYLRRVRRCPELQLNIVDELFVIATKGQPEDLQVYRKDYARIWPRKIVHSRPDSPSSAGTNLVLQISSNAAEHLLGILAFSIPQLCSSMVTQNWSIRYLAEYREPIGDAVESVPSLGRLEYLSICGDDWSVAQILEALGGRTPHLRGLLDHLSARPLSALQLI